MVYTRYFDLDQLNLRQAESATTAPAPVAAPTAPAPMPATAPQNAPSRGWTMWLKRDNVKGCPVCGTVNKAGTRAYWDKATYTVWCPACVPTDIDGYLASKKPARTEEPATAVVVPTKVEIKDGIYTVNLEDDYRTIRIKTAKKGNLAGKRIVSYLSGPNNDSDYTGFAFLNESGFQVWGRFRGLVNGPLNAAIEVLANPAEAGRRYAIESGRCYLCGRTLTVEQSITDGIGPICAAK